MRKVSRRRMPVPEALRDDKVRAAKETLAMHYQLPADERQRRRPPLESRVWTALSVRESLTSLFHAKCAYCERPVGEYEYGAVSHHRPTSNAIGAGGTKSDAVSYEHYSWFAYEWENLFLSCAQCDRSKRNSFPVNGPRARLRCTWNEAESSEVALLINPCRMEPRKHLQFTIGGQVIGTDEVGRATIDVLSLNRSELIENRSTKFSVCLDSLVSGHSNQQAFGDFRRELDDSAPFSGAARIAFFDLLSEFAYDIGVTKPLFRTLADDAIRIILAAEKHQVEDLHRLARLDHQLRDERFEFSILEATGSHIRYIGEPRTSQLRRVSIRNFKGISQLDLNISPAHPTDVGAPCIMLLGENSTGKSTTLQAIALALMGEKMRSRMGVLAEDFLPREVHEWQLNDTLTPEVILEFDTGQPVSLQIDPLTKEFIGDEEPNMVLFAFGSRRFFGKDVVRWQRASSLKSLFDPFAKLQHPGRWLQELRDEDFNAVARAMREVLILKIEDRIDRDDEGRLFVRAHGRDTPLERLSDGYRSLTAMVFNIMRGMIDKWGDLENARGIVLIDEIEIHLHPRWKLRVVSALRRAMPNVQFVATTHDPLCLRGLRGGEVHVLVRNEEQQIHALTDLPDIRGLRAEQLLTSEFFGLSSTADPEVEEALERLALPVDASGGSRRMELEAIGTFRWIGDTPFEQIVNEALRRFINEAIASPEINRSHVREDAVNDVLNRLRALRAQRQL